MRTVPYSFFAALSLALLITSTASAEISWQTNLKNAHQQAQSQGKLMLLHFYSDDCIWCDRLEEGSFKSAKVADAIDGNFIPVKIHGGKNPKLTEMFKVTKFPTDVIVTADGQTLSHTVSPQQASRYVAMLSGAATKAPGVDVNTPAQTQIAAETKTMPGGGAVKAVSSRTNEASIKPAKTPMKSENDPELAMQGFCPVTVINEDRWVEGNPKFGVIHLGKLYLFASADSMQTFLADPVPYTPVLNEIDVVRFFEERKIVKGKREWGLKDPTHNRMFFFADEAAMNHFWEEYERYTGAAIKVMEKAVRDSNPGI